MSLMSLTVGKKEKVVIKEGHTISLNKGKSSHIKGYCDIKIVNNTSEKSVTNPVPFHFLIELETKMYEELSGTIEHKDYEIIYENRDPCSNRLYNSVRVIFSSLEKSYTLKLYSDIESRVSVDIKKKKQVDSFLQFLQDFIAENYNCKG